MAELKTEKQNRVLANEKAQKNASEVEQQNEIYRDKILELEDEKYKIQEQVEGIKNAIHFQASDLEKVKSEGIQYIKGSLKVSLQRWLFLSLHMIRNSLWNFSTYFAPVSTLFQLSFIDLMRWYFEFQKNLTSVNLIWTNV